MPRIRWDALPRQVKAHLRDRAKQRQVSEADLFALSEWIAQDPEVPDGEWYKDFETFKLCGKGDSPSTFRRPGRRLAANGCRTHWARLLPQQGSNVD
jgi:hypothetical protein